MVLLLLDRGADVTVREYDDLGGYADGIDNEGERTPFFVAAERGYREIVFALLAAQPEAYVAQDADDNLLRDAIDGMGATRHTINAAAAAAAKRRRLLATAIWRQRRIINQ